MKRPGCLVVFALLVLVAACRGGAQTQEVTSAVVIDSGDSHPEARATLDRECVVAGAEQALTVSVESGVPVQYVSTYADGESGREPPHGGGHGGVGQATSSGGSVQQRWTISEDAPPGLVVVYVNALLPGDAQLQDPDRALTRLMLSYWLTGADEECPPEGELEPGDPPAVSVDTRDEHPRVRSSLSDECVQVGDEQALTVWAEAGTAVGYVSVYANGENGHPRPNGGGYGGAGFGLVAEEGKVELNWKVEDSAPLGVVRVLVSASLSQEDPVRQGLAFLLVGPQEECP